jgi:WD40 repeat protein
VSQLVTDGHLLLDLKGHAGLLRTASFSHVGTRIITSGEDCSAKVWNSKTGEKEVDLAETGPVFGAYFNPDGTEAAAFFTEERYVRAG